jgi:putative nucleotidyltransferase with HDIG domain
MAKAMQKQTINAGKSSLSAVKKSSRPSLRTRASRTARKIYLRGAAKFHGTVFSDSPTKTLLRLLQKKHPIMFEHSVQVASLTRKIAIELGRTKTEARLLQRRALLHDIGKLPLPKWLMKKKGLSRFERWVIKQHPRLGAWLVEGFVDKKTAKLILEHQEEIDGSGYPRRLTGKDLDSSTRIITIADDFSAMTQARGYNKPFSQADALKDLLKKSAKGRYDASVVKALVKIKKAEGIDLEKS